MSPAAAPVTKVTIDFSKAREGGGASARVTPGDYKLLVTATPTVVPNKSGEGKHILWPCRIIAGGYGTRPSDRGVINHRTDTRDDYVWSLRQWLQDLLVVEVPRTKRALDLTKYVGKTIGVTLGDGKPYTGQDKKQRVSSEVKASFPAAMFDQMYGEHGAAGSEDEEGNESSAPSGIDNGVAAVSAGDITEDAEATEEGAEIETESDEEVEEL